MLLIDIVHFSGKASVVFSYLIGGSQQLVHIVEPVEFTRLLKPDAQNPLAQAIVYQSGKPFNATKTERNPRGRNYLSVHFSRET